MPRCWRVCLSLQTHGAIGFTSEHDLSLAATGAGVAFGSGATPPSTGVECWRHWHDFT